ncbi:MAG: glycosyltransferase [Fervidobacterium sp.]
MMNYSIIVVSPYSPRWSNIASVRWEKLSKYISKNHEVTFITSSFKESFTERRFDLGNARFIEIPLRFYRTNPFSTRLRENLKESTLKRKVKAELRVILEKILPVSAGGMLYHDVKAYKAEVNKSIESSLRNGLLPVLITTYDPWFTLNIGRHFKQKYHDKLVWISDFRDPSFDIHESKISRIPLFNAITRKMLKSADMITVVTHKMVEDYRRLTGKEVIFLPNGLDERVPEIYEHIKKDAHTVSVAYTGSLYPNVRELSYFVKALKEIMETANINVVFEYAGKDASKVVEEFKKVGLENLLKNYGQISRNKALEIQKNSDVLLLIVYTGNNSESGKSIRTGKVYEYLASGKPIIAIAPTNWEMKEELELDGVSKVFDKSQTSEIANYLIQFARNENIKMNTTARKEVIERYSYNNLARKLEEDIEELISKKFLKSDKEMVKKLHVQKK